MLPNCTLDATLTLLAQQTNPKLFLAFCSGIHKVLPKTLGDLLQKIYLCAFWRACQNPAAACSPRFFRMKARTFWRRRGGGKVTAGPGLSGAAERCRRQSRRL